MKKQIFYLASAALAVGLAACSNELIDDEVSNITLQEGELAAAFEGVEQEDADTRVKLDGTNIVWDRSGEEKIAVYSEALDAYYQYNLKNTTAEDKTKAVFTANNKNALPADFKPTLAFYPYSDELLNDVSGGQFLYALEADNDYVPGAINMPMVGKVSNGTINFVNTAALLKVTVVNMPAGKHYAKLSHGNKSISGSAQIDLENTPYTLKMQSDAASYIKYNATASLTAASQTTESANDDDDAKSVAAAYQFVKGATYDFYFVLPAGTYDKTLTFALGNKTKAGADHDDTGNAAYSRALSIKRNTMYSTTLRYTDDESPVIESGNLAALNKQLANATTSGEFTADLSGETGNIYIPELANTSDVITLNLTLGDNTNDDKAITIKSTSKKTPKVVVNVEQGVKTAAVEQTPAVLNDVALNIELPNSPVTLAPVGEAVTIKNVTADTYEDALTLSEGTTVGTLVLQNKTNVYVAEGAKIETDVYCDAESKGLYAFYQDKEVDIKRGTTEDNSEGGKYTVALGNDDLYKLYYPVNNSTVTLKEAQPVAKEITISAGKTVTIDLATFELSQNTEAKSVIKVDGTLYIKGTTGSISSEKAVPAIVVNAGGKVYLQSGIITNSDAEAVQLNGAGAIFEVTGGQVKTTKNSGDAITVTLGSAEIKTNTNATADNAVADVTGNVKVAAGGTFTLTSGYVSGTVAAEGSSSAGTSATAPAAAATVNIKGGTLEATGESASALTLEAKAANAPVNATISGGVVTSKAGTIVLTGGSGYSKPSLTISDGVVSSVDDTDQTVIADATGAAEVTISGGTIKNVSVGTDEKKTETAQGTAIAQSQADGSLTITGGTILAATAIDITNGSLAVTGTGTVDIQGTTTVISATSTSNKANINLENANATYTAGDKVTGTAGSGYVLYNTDNTAVIGTLSISKGNFVGDVKSDKGEEFISGGTFSKCSNLYDNQKTYLKEGRILSYDEPNERWTVVIETH